MRKKYLSALLFGALLVTSAGTFTSCKDYDDEINDLQEQIDKVVTDLESLKTAVDGLGGYVTSVKVEGGKLIVTADGKDISYDLPAGTEMEEIKIENDHLYVGDKDLGQVTGEVTVKDGVLMIGGEEAGLKVGTDVVIKDESNGIYTIQIGDKTIQLPMASASITSLLLTSEINKYKYENNYYFSQGYLTDATAGNVDTKGINWGVAPKDLSDWTGPKGPVAKGQLLIGAINTFTLTVTPRNADLSTSEFTLVDLEGKEAPVEVTVLPKEKLEDDELTTGSRAASVDGEWTLGIIPTVTADNIATAYTKDNENLLYALAIDGKVMTDYNIVVDTWTKTQANDYTAKPSVGSKFVTLNNDALQTTDPSDNETPWIQNRIIYNIPLGKSKLSYQLASLYDVQIDIAPESIEDAELLGISIDKSTNTLNVSEKAAANIDKKVKLNFVLLGVNGQTSEFQVTLGSFVKTVVEDEVTLSNTAYKINPSTEANAKNIIINMEDVFSGLSAEQSTALTSVTWEGSENFFLKGNISGVKYYANEADAKANDTSKAIDIEDDTAGSRVRNIKYAVISVTAYNGNADATDGDHKLTAILSTAQGQIKKVVAPITVTLPKFEEVCIKSATWTENKEEANFRLTTTGKLNIMTAYKLADDVTVGSSLADNKLVVEFDKVELEDGNLVSPIGTYSSAGSDEDQNTVTINNLSSVSEVSVNAYALDKDNMLTELSAVSKFVIAGVEGFTIESPKYTVKLTTILDGTKIVYFDKDKNEATPSINGTSGNFVSITSTDGNPGQADKFKIALKFDNEYYQLNGVGLLDGNTISGDNWDFEFNANAGESVTADYTYSNTTLSISNLPSKGQNYTVEMTPVYTGAVKVDGDEGKVSVITKLPAITINVVQSSN